MPRLWRRPNEERKVQNRTVFWSTWIRKKLENNKILLREKPLGWKFFLLTNEWIRVAANGAERQNGITLKNKQSSPKHWEAIVFFSEHCCVLLILLYFSICCQKILSEKEMVWNTSQWICPLLKAKLGVGLLKSTIFMGLKSLERHIYWSNKLTVGVGFVKWLLNQTFSSCPYRVDCKMLENVK